MTPDALMLKVAAAFEKGDLQPLLDAIDDNTVWKAGSSLAGVFRFGGQYQHRAGILEVTAKIATTYVFRRFKPREVICSGDVAWGLFDMEAEHVPTGKPIKLDFVLRWRVQNDKLLEHQAFFDTASLLVQQGAVLAAAPPKG